MMYGWGVAVTQNNNHSYGVETYHAINHLIACNQSNIVHVVPEFSRGYSVCELKKAL